MNIQLEELIEEKINVIREENKNREKKKRMIIFAISIVMIIIAIIYIINFLNKKKEKNFIHIILDVSKSLKEPYENLILKKDEFNYNTLLKNIEFYSYFDRVNLITNIIGTKQGKFFDLIGLLTKLDSIINERDIEAKINNYENQEIYECNQPDSKISNIYKKRYQKLKIF